MSVDYSCYITYNIIYIICVYNMYYIYMYIYIYMYVHIYTYPGYIKAVPSMGLPQSSP